MRPTMRYAVVALLLAVAACGGRKVNPVQEKRAIDASLSCQHLAAERQVNEARITDLAGEQRAKEERNVGLVLAAPLFLDLSDAEQQEVRALEARNRHLDEERARRNCPAAE